MNIRGSTALVTGTNRGLGKALVEALREGGARRIYAATRKPDGVTSDAVVQPIMLDITNAAHVEAAAERTRGDLGRTTPNVEEQRALAERADATPSQRCLVIA